MCEGLLRTYTRPETGLLPIFNGDDSGFALSQEHYRGRRGWGVRRWEGAGEGVEASNLFHLKAIWRPYPKKWPSRYLPILINLGIWLNYSGFSKSCTGRKSHALIKIPCMSWKVYSITTGYKSCSWNRDLQMEIQPPAMAQGKEEENPLRDVWEL